MAGSISSRCGMKFTLNVTNTTLYVTAVNIFDIRVGAHSREIFPISTVRAFSLVHGGDAFAVRRHHRCYPINFGVFALIVVIPQHILLQNNFKIPGASK